MTNYIIIYIKFLDMSKLVEKVLTIQEMVKYESILLYSIDEIIALNKRVRFCNF